MAYQHAYIAGSSTLEVYDFETGEAKTVEVDPLLGPTATAEALYKKARKRRKTAGAVEPLLEAAATEAAYLEQVEFTLTELNGTGEDDRAALEEIAAELVDAKLMAPVGKGAAAAIRREEKGGKGGKKGGKNAPAGGGGKRKAREEAMANIRTYAAPSGKEVLVGRNSKGNEAVSLRIGQDQDVWFHVRGRRARTSSCGNSRGRRRRRRTCVSPRISPRFTPSFERGGRWTCRGPRPSMCASQAARDWAW